MASARTITLEVGWEDDGNILFVSIEKENIALVRKALAYLYKQEQEEKKRARETSQTCCNCKFAQSRNRYDGTLTCAKKIVNKYYHKVVRPSGNCELFSRKEE